MNGKRERFLKYNEAREKMNLKEYSRVKKMLKKGIRSTEENK